MLLNSADATRFPILKKYLQFDFGQLASNTKLIDGVTKWGGFGDAADAKRLIMFGSRPLITIAGTRGGFSQFNQFPDSISVVLNMVKAFEIKDDMEGNNKFLNELVFVTSGHGRLFQIGLKLLELVIQGNLLVSKDTTVVPDDNAKALKVIKDRVTAFENDVYGGVNTSGALFF